MDKNQVIRLQKTMGVAPDGIIGRATLTAVFRKLGAGQVKASNLAQAANIHFKKFGILDDYLIFAHFLAQAAKETGSFFYDEEIASGKAYENRTDLGNVNLGDGVKFKGRGIFQLTGRANYILYGKLLGIDLVTNPAIVKQPDISVLVACQYWKQKKITDLALKDDVVGVTKLINGGKNGLDERIAFLNKIKSWIA